MTITLLENTFEIKKRKSEEWRETLAQEKQGFNFSHIVVFAGVPPTLPFT